MDQPPSPDPNFLLGQIHAMVQSIRDGQAEQNKRFDKLDERIDTIDGRLRVVEQKAAIAGAVSGGAVSVGIALIAEGLRQWFRAHGPGIGN